MNNIIKMLLFSSDSPSLMLTGGQSAKLLYDLWASSSEMMNLMNSAQFYFGDERCVPPSDHESNYKLVVDHLFLGISRESIHRIQAESEDLDLTAKNYAKSLPNKIDILILSVGEDGHIASLFPRSLALRENRRLIVPVVGDKSPFRRLTITPALIKRAKQVFVLAFGEKKRRIYEKALLDRDNFFELPARLVIDHDWIFEE